VVENSTVSPSRAIHTTEVCGPPSRFSVATVAKFRPSSRSRISGVNVSASSLMARLLVRGSVRSDASR
jgi:hypothetical protein